MSENIPKIELVEAKEPKRKIWLDWLQFIISSIMIIATFLGIFLAVPQAINNAIKSSNEQKQTQVVIEPRDGDVIVKDGDDYKLLQLIELSDINFPTKIQEVQHTHNNSIAANRVDINNFYKEDWSKRDSFSYIINSFSINRNKIINLLSNIDRLTVYCDFYTEKNISTFVDLEENAFYFEMIENKPNLELTRFNVKSQKEYVTKEINDGIEWVKIRVEIVYNIGGQIVTDTLTTDWIATAADYFE